MGHKHTPKNLFYRRQFDTKAVLTELDIVIVYESHSISKAIWFFS